MTKKISRRGFFKWGAAAAATTTLNLSPLHAIAAPWDDVDIEYHDYEYDLYRSPSYYGETQPGPFGFIEYYLLENAPVVQSVEFSDPSTTDRLIWYAQEAEHPEDGFYVEGTFDGRLGKDFTITAHDSERNLDYSCDFNIASYGEITLRKAYTIIDGEKEEFTMTEPLADKAKKRLRGFISHINEGPSPQEGRIEYIDTPSNPSFNPPWDGARYARLLVTGESGSPRITNFCIKDDSLHLMTTSAGEPAINLDMSLDKAQRILCNKKEQERLRESIFKSSEWTDSFDALWFGAQEQARREKENFLEKIFPLPREEKTRKDVPLKSRKAYDTAKTTTEEALFKEVLLCLKIAPLIAKDKGQPSPYFLKVNSAHGKRLLTQLHHQQHPKKPAKAPQKNGPPKHKR
ncbi:MAG: twin-arginine translocation signal domain-containing protein [Bdellovibrionales bacterium]